MKPQFVLVDGEFINLSNVTSIHRRDSADPQQTPAWRVNFVGEDYEVFTSKEIAPLLAYLERVAVNLEEASNDHD